MGLLLKIIIGLPGFALAIILHEVAHAWMADKLGDRTAREQGRISLDPRRHLDVAGAVMYLVSVMFLGFGFGWAKPVPINTWNFRDRRAGMALTGISGPLANVLQALAWSQVLRLYTEWRYGLPTAAIAAVGTSDPVWLMLFSAFAINVVLLVFNMVPLPPLDGSRLLAWMLPEKGAQVLDRMEPFGMGLLFLGMALGAFQYLWPAVEWVFNLLL